MLIEGPGIVAIGSADDLGESAREKIDHTGAVIVPGLRDAHLHPVGYAASLQRASLKAARDFGEVQEIVTTAARQQEPGTAIVGLRLDDEGLAEMRLPDRHVLDAAVRDRPVMLIRYCGHVAVANTAALELAGIDQGTPDPPGGSIDRDAVGHPTGVLRETAFEPVTTALRPLAPMLSSDDVAAGLVALASTGLTSIGAIAGTGAGIWGGAKSELGVLLDAAGRSPIRLGVFVIAPTPDALRQAAEDIGAAVGPIRFLGVKMFSDGSFGGHTAAMHEPYADKPGETGTDRLDPVWARQMAEASLALGGRVAIHAIGDRAAGNVLDLMETLIDDGADPAHLRMEHASVLTEGDIERFGRLGVTASVQPAFIASETEWLEKRMGPERLKRTYAFRSLLDAGAPLAGGSDSPVEPPHPLHGIAAAQDRLGIVPEQALSAAEALHLFTLGAGNAMGENAALQPAASATFTILGTNPLEASTDELRAATVLGTWRDGVQVDVPQGIDAWPE